MFTIHLEGFFYQKLAMNLNFICLVIIEFSVFPLQCSVMPVFSKGLFKLKQSFNVFFFVSIRAI